MSWNAADPELIEQVRERQRVTIRNYANDPDLLNEHVGMEDNFQAGGYGERQIEELLQNAIDQLDAPGRVELRLADGTLYCANEGAPFGAKGIKAIAGAFLSAKRDEKIGRFGLGFKSVLGVSEHPQIISRSISFGFNEPDARTLLTQLPYQPERFPTLRVPSVLDPETIAREDPNVREMMAWASTIVRLPLQRGGPRLVERLKKFDVRYLLFADQLSQVDISLHGKTRSFRRRSVPGADGIVELQAPDQSPSAWRVLNREHRISREVRATLPGLFDRDKVRVSYALPLGSSRREDGEFWAWFPLRDKTTAQGIFNAQWQVNDDRTAMLPASALNAELLGVAAELLIDAAVRVSTPDDPARHFDVLPARGREVRSEADRFMSRQIPKLVRQRQLIPTATGDMRAPAHIRVPAFRGADGRAEFGLPPEVARRWGTTVLSDDAPHWSCYANHTRRARLGQLLTDEDDEVVAKTISPAAWLSELARPRSLESVDAAVYIFLEMRKQKQEIWQQFSSAAIIPLSDGKFAKASEAKTVLLPGPDEESPDGVRLVETSISRDPAIRPKLVALGVREMSRDDIAEARAELARVDWPDEDWGHLWGSLAAASQSTGQKALHDIRSRGIHVKVPTQDGSWREAREVVADAMQAPSVPARQPDHDRVGGRVDLLRFAGCLDADFSHDYPMQAGQAFAEYRDEMQGKAARTIDSQFRARAVLRFPDGHGVGPLDLLKDLAESQDPQARIALARWTARLVQTAPDKKTEVIVDFIGAAANKKADVTSFETWCIQKYGQFNSSLGPLPVAAVVGHDLTQYKQMLPVAQGPSVGLYPLPRELGQIPEAVLKSFLKRDGYVLPEQERSHLAELLATVASSYAFSDVTDIPAINPRSGLVKTSPVTDVVFAAPDQLDDVIACDLVYVPESDGDDAMREAWGIQNVSDVVAKRIEWLSGVDALPLMDLYPAVGDIVDADIEDVTVLLCQEIVRRTTGPKGGVLAQRLPSHLNGRVVLVDDELDEVEILLQVSLCLRLRMSRQDALDVIAEGERQRRSERIQRVRAEESLTGKLIQLVDVSALADNLPHGLLAIVEQRQGKKSAEEIAELFLSSYGNEALLRLKEPMRELGLRVPDSWAGSPRAQEFVTDLGFPLVFAGSRTVRPQAMEVVPGKVELKPLHDFQAELVNEIRELVLIREKTGEPRRGLLYLPTGAGKTRVTAESVARMLRDDELEAPVLWIAQSEELCEQAIVAWTEVWRAIGDERPLELTRYWDKYEADESVQELQVVVAVDAKLESMIKDPANKQAHAWLQNSKLVVVDEAHRAGSSRYVDIFRWLGISQGSGARTSRPLLGLTATPYRGTNEEVNRQFAARFGNRRLNVLDEEDPIGQLREMRVLSNVEHQLLDGVVVDDRPSEGRGGATGWQDVSRHILDKLGENIERTQLLVDHIMNQDERWQILVFTPSVVSAHVTAALIRSLGRSADAVDGSLRGQERRRRVERFKKKETQVLVNCDLLTQGFDAPKVRALYIARPTFSPNRYVQMVGRGLRGPLNGGTEDCLVVNVVDTFTQFDKDLAYTEFDYLWTKKGVRTR